MLRKKGDGFLLFLKAFSWETVLWVTLGDFTVKDAKYGKEILFNWKSIRQKQNSSMRKIITVICVTYVQKDF